MFDRGIMYFPTIKMFTKKNCILEITIVFLATSDFLFERKGTVNVILNGMSNSQLYT